MSRCFVSGFCIGVATSFSLVGIVGYTAYRHPYEIVPFRVRLVNGQRELQRIEEEERMKKDKKKYTEKEQKEV